MKPCPDCGNAAPVWSIGNFFTCPCQEKCLDAVYFYAWGPLSSPEALFESASDTIKNYSTVFRINNAHPTIENVERAIELQPPNINKIIIVKVEGFFKVCGPSTEGFGRLDIKGWADNVTMHKLVAWEE